MQLAIKLLFCSAVDVFYKISSYSSAMANDMPDPGDVASFDAGETSFDTTRMASSFASGWQGSPSRGWINLLYDTISGQAPNSVEADRRGIALGKFLVENAELAKELEETRKKFEHHILPDITNKIPDVSITYFENWASTTTGLLLHAKPTTVRQVKYLVKQAKDLNVKVGCGGSYHSWSPLFPDGSTKAQQGLLINTTELKLDNCKNGRIRIRKVDGKDEYEAVIAPGVTTGELMRECLANDVCLESDVILPSVTYGGILTTGCHGVGKDQAVMSDLIKSIAIVDHNGDLKEYPKDFHDLPFDEETAMNILRVNMGVFGVVVEFTIRLQPMQYVTTKNTYPTVAKLFYGDNPHIKELLRDNWSVQCMWFPFNSLDLISGMIQAIPFIHIWQPKADKVWVRSINKSPHVAETSGWDKMQQRMTDTLQHIMLDTIGSRAIERYPQLIPLIGANSLDIIRRNQEEEVDEELPHAIHFRYGITLAPVYDMEFAFPLTLDDDQNGFETLLKAVRIVVEEAEQAARGGILEFASYPLSTTLDIRVIKKSSCLLCPAVKRDVDQSTHTAFVEILSFAGTQSYKSFFHDIGKKWIELGGIPHWCKQWTFLEDVKIFDRIHNYYGDNISKFRGLLQALNGDDRMFVNQTMKKVLQL